MFVVVRNTKLTTTFRILKGADLMWTSQFKYTAKVILSTVHVL